VSTRACSHPIHTIVFVALIASTTYIGLLEGSLFERSIGVNTVGKVDFGYLQNGSKKLRTGQETSWKWQVEDDHTLKAFGVPDLDLALLTFVFPESYHTAPKAGDVPIPESVPYERLPSSTNLLSPISSDNTLAYFTPYTDAGNFLSAAQEISTKNGNEPRHMANGTTEVKKWIMKSTKHTANGSGGLSGWARDAWTSFLDLLKVRFIALKSAHAPGLTTTSRMQRPLTSSSWS